MQGWTPFKRSSERWSSTNDEGRGVRLRRGAALLACALLFVTTTACAGGMRPASRPGVGAWTVIASWYGPKYHGRQTASGRVYDMYELTAAHKTLPFGTRLRVTHARSQRSVVVEITDRGPFIKGREIDLSYGAADALGMVQEGVAEVRLQRLN